MFPLNFVQPGKAGWEDAAALSGSLLASLISPTSAASFQFFPFLEVGESSNLSVLECASAVGLETVVKGCRAADLPRHHDLIRSLPAGAPFSEASQGLSLGFPTLSKHLLTSLVRLVLRE